MCGFMTKTSPIFAVITASFLAAASAEAATKAITSQFTYRDAVGAQQSAPVESKYYPQKLQLQQARFDRSVNSKLVRAATIAQERAHAHSRRACWHYVKEALIAAGVVDSRPKTELAKQAAGELTAQYGFKKLAVHDPYQAPFGSVLVYSGKGAGHIELRTRDGFVSDFKSKTPSKRPLLGVYAKS